MSILQRTGLVWIFLCRYSDIRRYFYNVVVIGGALVVVCVPRRIVANHGDGRVLAEHCVALPLQAFLGLALLEERLASFAIAFLMCLPRLLLQALLVDDSCEVIRVDAQIDVGLLC